MLFFAGWRITALGKGNTFFFDEWNFVLDRADPSIHSLLTPHNGHLSIIPVVLYQAFLRVFGGGTYVPFRESAMLLHCGIALAVAVIVKRRVGYIASLSAAGVVAFMGSGWQNWLWGFQIGMEMSVLTGLFAIVCLTGEPFRNRQWIVVILLLVSVASSGVGVSVLLGVFLLAQKRRWRLVTRSSIVVVLFYGLWAVTYGESQIKEDNFRLLPSYVARSGAAVMAGIGTWDLAIGGVLLGAMAVLFRQKARALWRDMPEVASLVLILVMGWILSALTRAQFNEPGASRYVHVGVSLAVPISVLVVCGSRPTRLKALALFLVSVVAVAGSWDVADSAGREFRDRSATVRAELTAMMQVKDVIRHDYRPDPSRAPQLTFARFRKFAKRFDAPLMNAQEIASVSEPVRKEMDRVFLESTRVGLIDAPQPAGWNCATAAPNSVVKIPAGRQVWFSGVHSVEVNRMARETTSFVPSKPGAPSILKFGNDSNSHRWSVRLISASDVQICDQSR